MANTSQIQSAPSRTSIGRLIGIIILALVVLVGLAILIAWLAIRPKRLLYSIENASTKNFNLTNNHHFNAGFQFTIRAYNPNHKVSIYYDKIDATAYYDDNMIGFSSIQPFYQRTQNVTHLGLNVPAKDVTLPDSAVENLKSEKARGRMNLEIKIKAKVRFKVGKLKSRHRIVRITCGPVNVPIPSYKNFDTTRCDVDL